MLHQLINRKEDKAAVTDEFNRFWLAGISFLLFSLINSVCFFLITSIDDIGSKRIELLDIFFFPFFFCAELLGFSFLIKRRTCIFPFFFCVKLLRFLLLIKRRIYILFPLLVPAIKEIKRRIYISFPLLAPAIKEIKRRIYISFPLLAPAIKEIKRRIYISFPLLVLAIKILLILYFGVINFWWYIIIYWTTYFSFLFNIGDHYIDAHHLDFNLRILDFNFGIIGLLFHTVGMFLYQAVIIFLAIKITACLFPVLSQPRRSNI